MRDLQSDLEWFNETLGHCHAHGPVARIAVEVLPEAIDRAIKAEADKENLLRKIESLTPGGSEFHNDPDKCIQFARDRMDGVKRIKEIMADNAALRQGLEIIANITEITEQKPYGTVKSTPTLDSVKRYAGEVLAATKSGADMLQELEGLRKIRALLIEKKHISEQWQTAENMMYPSEKFIAAIYEIKDLDRQIDQALAELQPS